MVGGLTDENVDAFPIYATGGEVTYLLPRTSERETMTLRLIERTNPCFLNGQ